VGKGPGEQELISALKLWGQPEEKRKASIKKKTGPTGEGF